MFRSTAERFDMAVEHMKFVANAPLDVGCRKPALMRTKIGLAIAIVGSGSCCWWPC